MVVDVNSMLVLDEIVITCKHERRRGDGFQRLQFYMGLVEQQLRHNELPPARCRVSYGGGYSAIIDLTTSMTSGYRRFARIKVGGHRGDLLHFGRMPYRE